MIGSEENPVIRPIRLVISDAMLTSSIELLAGDRFVSVEAIESDVYCSRF